MKSKASIGQASLLTVGMLFGLSGVIAKYLSRSINPYQVVELRFGVAFLGSSALLVLLGQKLDFEKINKRVLALFSLTFPVAVMLFTESIFHASVALAVFSFYTATLLSQFTLGRVFFAEHITLYKKISIISMLIAVLAFTHPFSHFTMSLGLLLGLLSGVVQGVASSFQKQLSGTDNKNGLLFVQTLTGTLIAAVMLLIRGNQLVPSLAPHQWLVVVVFGLSMLAITYLFLIGYKYLNLGVGSILVSSELIFGPLFAFLLLSERVPSSVLVGGVFTVIAAVLTNLPTTTSKTKTSNPM